MVKDVALLQAALSVHLPHALQVSMLISLKQCCHSDALPQCLLSACIVLYLMFVLSWKLTAVTIALAPLSIFAAVISSFVSSNLKTNRLAADARASAIARHSLQQPAAVKALCIEDAVAAHYGSLHDTFITSFSPAKNSVCRILVSSSFQVTPPASFDMHACACACHCTC